MVKARSRACPSSIPEHVVGFLSSQPCGRCWSLCATSHTKSLLVKHLATNNFVGCSVLDDGRPTERRSALGVGTHTPLLRPVPQYLVQEAFHKRAASFLAVGVEVGLTTRAEHLDARGLAHECKLGREIGVLRCCACNQYDDTILQNCDITNDTPILATWDGGYHRIIGCHLPVRH